MTRVKICGLTNAEDLESAVDAGADAVGYICDVSVDTPREVSPERAESLIAATPPFVTSVLVTMASDLERTADLVADLGPDAVQLHGSIDAERLSSFRESVDASVLLAVDADDPTTAESYDEVVDGFVVDTADEDGAGGTGETHDWSRTRTAARELDSPVVLAGGLTPENVAEAVRTVEPFAVDVASGVETDGGIKDADAVASFVERATRAGKDHELEAQP
ncbi:phosphoribosylanthranilate isomerase [Halopiger goleimassiliensis]|uniref:phosphoribosylanthranilate isomerase n=1 Tax=Halopiger goleimassiliensis TaxID=1293048 RepID=UPI0006781FB7|nr:phosphoribosylanthranilate isomerase [Halopiger goleimassiliensis]